MDPSLIKDERSIDYCGRSAIIIHPSHARGLLFVDIRFREVSTNVSSCHHIPGGIYDDVFSYFTFKPEAL